MGCSAESELRVRTSNWEGAGEDGNKRTYNQRTWIGWASTQRRAARSCSQRRQERCTSTSPSSGITDHIREETHRKRFLELRVGLDRLRHSVVCFVGEDNRTSLYIRTLQHWIQNGARYSDDAIPVQTFLRDLGFEPELVSVCRDLLYIDNDLVFNGIHQVWVVF